MNKMQAVVKAKVNVKKTPKPKVKTRDEKQANLDKEKKDAWENFKQLDYDKMSPGERESITRHLYETMGTKLAPEMTKIDYDFWKAYKDTDEIKNLNRFISHVDDTLVNLPKNPTPSAWLDKNNGIIPQMKREWKAQLEPFKSERVIRRQIEKIVEETFNLPENQGKDLRVDVGGTIQKVIEDIEENVYKPTRAKIEKIEEKITKIAGKTKKV